jgi:FtsH-binding integral membrane protein
MSQQYPQQYPQQQPPQYPYPQTGSQPPPPGFNTQNVSYGPQVVYPSQPPKYGDPNFGYAAAPQQPYNPGYGVADSYNVTNLPNDNSANNWAGFADKTIRRMFIQKVYSILSLQLLVTFGFTAIVVFTPSIASWFRAHIWSYYIAYIVFLTLYITLMCCEGPRRSYPTNFILLALFTFAMSYMVAMICAHHKLDTVLIAVGITFACCTAVSLLSFWTKFDFTRFGWALAIASLGLFIAGLCMIFIRVKIAYIVYCAIGVVIFILFLAYDTQLITGGKKYSISPEEYILGSIMLYVDIVYIFLFILQLVSAGRD